MKVENFKDKEVYYITFNDQIWIIQYRQYEGVRSSKEDTDTYYAFLKPKNGYDPEYLGFLKGWFALHEKNYTFARLATPSEVAHLEACIKANKHVPFEEINKEQEIILW